MFASPRRILTPALPADHGRAGRARRRARGRHAQRGAEPIAGRGPQRCAEPVRRLRCRRRRARREGRPPEPRGLHARAGRAPDQLPGARAEIPAAAGARRTATVANPIDNLAALVDTRTWTTGGGNTFPGAIAPWGEVQWSPDTVPDRSAGGGYSYGDTSITGYSLTHVSGPGCGAGGDIPMLPMTGALPDGNPNDVTTAFSNDHEIAQAGYYSAESNQPDTITSEFTATRTAPWAASPIRRPNQAGLLIKLHDSQNGEFAPSTADVVSDHEISGSETSGHFCGEASTTVRSRSTPRTSTSCSTSRSPRRSSTAATARRTPSTSPSTPRRTSRGAGEGRSVLRQRRERRARLAAGEPAWNFAAVKAAAQQDWNDLLGRMQISGGTYDRTQMFYSLLYKDFVEPNIVSDVNGQFMGADMQVHTVPRARTTSTACTPAGTSTIRCRSCRRCSTRRPRAIRRSRSSTTTRRTRSSSSGATTTRTTT